MNPDPGVLPDISTLAAQMVVLGALCWAAVQYGLKPAFPTVAPTTLALITAVVLYAAYYFLPPIQPFILTLGQLIGVVLGASTLHNIATRPNTSTTATTATATVSPDGGTTVVRSKAVESFSNDGPLSPTPPAPPKP